MALVRFGGGVMDVRGSHGGNTFSRNKGGAHVKTRTKGTNPSSNKQGISRSILGQCVFSWKTLSDPDRLSWSTFAAGNPVFNKIGNQIILSGQQMFNRFNAVNLHAGFTIVNTAPIAPVVDSPTALNLTCDFTGAGTIQVQLVGPSAFGGELMYLYISPAMSPGRSYVSSLLRFVGTDNYNLVVDVTSKWIAAFGTLPIVAGVRVFARAAVYQPATGLLSPFIQTSVTSV